MPPSRFTSSSGCGRFASVRYTTGCFGAVGRYESRLPSAGGTTGSLTGAGVSFFADLENVKYDSYHRSIANLTAAGAYDPATAPTAQNYNYSATNKDTNWAIGAGVDWPATDRLLVKASFLYYKTDGSADIVSQNNFGNPCDQRLRQHAQDLAHLKGTTTHHAMDVTALCLLEVPYSDDQYNGYQYVIPAAANATSYLNGYGAFIPYTAHIVYALAAYRF